MSTNKKVSPRSRARVKTKEDLLAQAAPPTRQQPRELKDRAKDLESKLHRLEVEIAAAPRLVSESRRRNRDLVPPPEKSTPGPKRGRRLTLAQAREKRRLIYMQVLEFAVTAVLFVGASAWLYHWWLSRTG